MSHLKPSDDGRLHAPSGSAAPEFLPPRRWVTGLFCLATITWVFAFSPEPLVWATVPGWIGWLAVLERSRTFRELVVWVVLFGALATAIGYSWLAKTVQDFGDVPVVPSWLLTALFGVVGVLHGLVFAFIHRSMLKRGRRPHTLVIAALMTACEALPIRLFPWSAGHGAVDVPPLVQAAEWGGVVAVSFALYCLATPIYEWFRWAFVGGGAPARPGAAAFTFGVGLAIFAFGALRYQQVNAEDEEATRRLRVAIAQANIGTHTKRQAEASRGLEYVDNLSAYRAVSEEAAAQDPPPHLVVWPETAVSSPEPIPMQRSDAPNATLAKIGYGFINDIGRDIAFLVGLSERAEGRYSIVSGQRLVNKYNVAALRQAGGYRAPWTMYRKVHLIPFGETMPFGIMEERLPGKHPWVAGELPQPLLELHAPKVTLAPFICYEGILAGHVREYVAGQRPDVLVSLTNDSWFGGSWEPYQHLNFTRFRAVEHRAPLVRSTNTGISAFVSSTGDVVSKLGVGERGVLIANVPLVDRPPTVYVRFGHHLPTALWVFVLAAWTLAILRPPPLERRA